MFPRTGDGIHLRTKPEQQEATHMRGFSSCAREDSNLHGLFAHKALNLARLPIPPQALAG